MKRLYFSATIFSVILFLTVHAFAATYFVKNDGDDSNSGLSDAKAWKTIKKVRDAVLRTGDNVFFKCGDKWIIKNYRLTIDWSGTAENRAVVGAYYMNNGKEVIGVKGKKPVFDGNDSYPKGDFKKARWGALVWSSKNNYVTVENIRAINSEGLAFNFENGTSLRALNLETQNTIGNGIQFYKVDTGLIENCVVRDHCRIAKEYPGNSWPSGISIVVSSKNITVRGCTIYEGYGEGIGVYKSSKNNIIEDNMLYDNQKINIYIEHARGNIVRRNIVYGTTNSEYYRRIKGPDLPDHGIAICDEPEQASFQPCENNKIYNNFIASCNKGIYLSTGRLQGSCIKDTEVYNNTIVDCGYSFYLQGPFKNSFVRNNISWNITKGGDWPSKIVMGRTYTPGLTWSHNLWTTEPDGDLSGPGDIIGIPKLNKTTGWRSLKGGDIKASDFALNSGSPAINAGTELGNEFAMATDCMLSNWSTGEIVLKNQNNYGYGWEIGAAVYAPNYTQFIPAPSLSIYIR